MNFFLLMDLIDHILSIVITLAVLIVVISLCIGAPHCKYIYLLSQSSNEKDVENLARHLALTKGCRHTDVERTWQSFVPTANRLLSNKDYKFSKSTTAKP